MGGSNTENPRRSRSMGVGRMGAGTYFYRQRRNTLQSELGDGLGPSKQSQQRRLGLRKPNRRTRLRFPDKSWKSQQLCQDRVLLGPDGASSVVEWTLQCRASQLAGRKRKPNCHKQPPESSLGRSPVASSLPML